MTGLEPKEFRAWVTELKGQPDLPDDSSKPIGKKVRLLVPNTLLAYYGGEYGSAGKSTVNWSGQLAALKDYGFKVEGCGDWFALDWLDYFREGTRDKELEGVIFLGHGHPESINLKEGVGKKGYDRDGNAPYVLRYDEWEQVISYHLGFGVIFACESGDNDGWLPFASNALTRLYKGQYNPLWVISHQRLVESTLKGFEVFR